MARYDTRDIRNFAIVGHNSSGKTTIADALLYKAKAVPRQGMIDEGTSIFDSDPESRDRKVTIELSIASCNYKSKEINVIDTPGYADFIAQSISALSAVEACMVCINAASGIMLNTRKTWEESTKRNLVRIVLITKLDNENIELPKLLASVKTAFGQNVIPINLPDQTGPGISKVTSIFDSAPAGSESIVSAAKERILETDDALLEKYLDGKELSREEIEGALIKSITERKIVPILCTSVVKGVGITEVLDALVNFVPAPTAEEKFSAQVFKCTSDPFVGKLSYIKVYGGTLSNDMALYNVRTKRQLKMGNLFKPFGKDQRNTTSVPAGDIVVITKLEESSISDTFCDPSNSAKRPDIPFPIPMISLAVEPKSKQDEARISVSLQKMADSDPTFKVARDPQTNELVITAMSQLHLDVTLVRMRRIYEVNVITKTPKIPFRESIVAAANGHHKHKKQSGGHGQYGEVYLKVEPVERGKGFEFLDEITQGKIPSQYVPSVEKGIREALDKGIIAGYPVTDVRVRLTDGSYHEVDSGPESFRLAGSKAFKAGFLQANPVLLEPLVNLQIFCPSKFIGDVTGQLTSRRGRILSVDTENDMQVVKALAPLMEVSSYSTDLNTITAGEGYFTMELSHYDVLPHRMAESIIAKSKKQQEEED